MAYTFLIFEFGGDEEAAQQARHKIDSWKQGFRLGNKVLSKFERTEAAGEAATAKADATAAKADATGVKLATAKAKHPVSSKAETEKEKHKEKKGAKKAEEDAAAPAGHIRMLVRLDFSDHEKLSFQRWLDRIPKEEPFQSAHGKIVRAGEAEHAKLTDQFDSLT